MDPETRHPKIIRSHLTHVPGQRNGLLLRDGVGVVFLESVEQFLVPTGQLFPYHCEASPVGLR
jgi:hypothetical protein